MESNDQKTRSILCFPIKDENDKVVGVAQLCNKVNGPHFTKFDEELAKAFSVYCCISIVHVRWLYCFVHSSFIVFNVQKRPRSSTPKQTRKRTHDVPHAGKTNAKVLSSIKQKMINFRFQRRISSGCLVVKYPILTSFFRTLTVLSLFLD